MHDENDDNILFIDHFQSRLFCTTQNSSQTICVNTWHSGSPAHEYGINACPMPFGAVLSLHYGEPKEKTIIDDVKLPQNALLPAAPPIS